MASIYLITYVYYFIFGVFNNTMGLSVYNVELQDNWRKMNDEDAEESGFG
jgi:hypothetical protein